jgi:hypothetical protein
MHVVNLSLSFHASCAQAPQRGHVNGKRSQAQQFLVEETHGTSGQCVSFSLIDAGRVLLPAYFFFLFHNWIGVCVVNESRLQSCSYKPTPTSQCYVGLGAHACIADAKIMSECPRTLKICWCSNWITTDMTKIKLCWAKLWPWQRWIWHHSAELSHGHDRDEHDATLLS